MEKPITHPRRTYSRWVSNQTLEDYSLRYTASSARRISASTVAVATTGSISFLALEVIGANIAIQYGLNHLLLALLLAVPLIFLISLPIASYAVKYHVDIDLLTRGAGFGYLGSSITSLVYASFTFIFLAFEATILAKLLNMALGIPVAIADFVSAAVVIPLILNGFTFINRFQVLTQPLWSLMQVAAIAGLALIMKEEQVIGMPLFGEGGFNLVFLGYALSILLALVSQIGEQVDYLRFMPDENAHNRKTRWLGMLFAGPGWIVMGGVKILIGALLGIVIMHEGGSVQAATDPNYMYLRVFQEIGLGNGAVALVLTVVFVVLSQIKINVTNGYAGSIAWSNFFSRLTHTHPGRIVWVFFNVAIAWVLMACGIYEASLKVLNLYSVLAVAWCGTLAADMLVNKKCGLSPEGIEFKRASLYDINPVGFGSMFVAVVIGLLCYFGALGELCAAYAVPVTLVCTFVACPALAWLTRGRYYIAREGGDMPPRSHCSLCGHEFEKEDMSYCPYYNQRICSLCCTLDSCCSDCCKPRARIGEQIGALLPERFRGEIHSGLISFLGFMLLFSLIIIVVFAGVYGIFGNLLAPPDRDVLFKALFIVFVLMEIIAAVFSMLFLLVSESRRRARDEFQKQNGILEHEIHERKQMAALLEQAKEAADEANQAKTRYLSGISHELRTPLNTILGYSEILDKASDIPEKHRKALDIVCRSGEYLADLIEGLLDISKIEARKLNLIYGNTNLSVLLDQLVTYFGNAAQRKHLDFEYKAESALPRYVHTDEKRLRQILTNLLSNAIKYTQHGKVSFSIRYRNEVAVFEVADSGIGIKKEDIQSIFEPFKRLAYTRVYADGTGLGLTITNLLVTIMGGELEVHSEYGHGSRFVLKLRLSRAAETDASACDYGKVAGYVTSGKQPFTVLEVDDNEEHRMLMSKILEPVGFGVVQADSCQSAFRQIREVRPDLVLVDISMPDGSGWDLLQKIRHDGIRIPVIMVSAEASEGNVPEDIRKMHNGYIIKPVRQEKLFEAIGRVLPVTFTYARQNDLPETLPCAGQGASASHGAGEGRVMMSDDIWQDYVTFAEIGYIQGILELNARLLAGGWVGKAEKDRLDVCAMRCDFAIFRGMPESVGILRGGITAKPEGNHDISAE